MIKDLSAKLVAAAAAINAKSREAYVAEQQSLESRKKQKMPMQPVPKAEPAAVTTAKKMAEAVEGTVPKTPREKALAAKSGHPKRITFGDVLKARGVQKEEVEAVEEGLMDTMKKIGKKVVDTVGHKDDVDLIKDLQKKVGVPQTGKKPVKEEKEESATHEKAEKKPNAFNWRTNPTKLPKKPGELTGHDSKKISTGTVYTKKYTNEDTSYSVEHEMFGEGNTLPGQQAEDGSWIDVMFAEGIKRVPVDELFVTEAKVGADHLHVSPVGNGKYKVHAVGSNFSDGIKAGEHLSDSELDDFAEMGGKVKHVKPEKKD